jgi:Domain of unknown function (DUF4124)
MARPLVVPLVFGIVSLCTGVTLGGDIYKWTDEQGRVHFSNRGESTANDNTPAQSDGGGQGWESVLEKQQGHPDFQAQSEAAINSLEMQVGRRKRERMEAQEQLEATQTSIGRATPTELPALRAREAMQISNLRRIDMEIMTMQTNIARIRAMRSADQDQRSAR